MLNYIMLTKTECRDILTGTVLSVHALPRGTSLADAKQEWVKVSTKNHVLECTVWERVGGEWLVAFEVKGCTTNLNPKHRVMFEMLASL